MLLINQYEDGLFGELESKRVKTSNASVIN